MPVFQKESKISQHSIFAVTPNNIGDSGKLEMAANKSV